MDMMRESIFSILGDLSQRSFLDIFSGSGIIALEAASRGAAYIEAVEMDPLKRRTLLENVKISPVRINLRFMPAELYVKRANRKANEQKPFDFIFIDPPFPYRHKMELLQSIAESPLMGKNTLLLLHFPREEESSKAPSLRLRDTRKYGRSIVNFYEI